MTDATTHQAQKSQRTRERLLDAALDVIATEGLAQTTTARICEAAGVSRGAQTHHYPTKNELVIAALDRMASQYEVAAKERLESLPPSERLLRTVIRALWDVFLDDRFSATALDVLVAARTDPSLQPAVVDADRTAIDAVVAFAPEITHPTATAEELAQVLEMTLYYFRGLALERGIHDDHKYRQVLVDRWCTTAERGLQQR